MVIDRIIKSLLPREDRFFVYLNSFARIIDSGADAFGGLQSAQGPDDFQRICDDLRLKEHEADDVSHLLFRELDKSFVTPLDREDLQALANSLDNIIDGLERCATQIILYKLPRLSPAMREMARVAQEAAKEVATCVNLLEHLHRDADKMEVHIIHVNSLENEGDAIYRKGLGALFETMVDPIELIREKEILDGIELTINCCEDVTDHFRSIVVKNR